MNAETIKRDPVVLALAGCEGRGLAGEHGARRLAVEIGGAAMCLSVYRAKRTSSLHSTGWITCRRIRRSRMSTGRSSRMQAGSISARCPTGATGASRWRWARRRRSSRIRNRRSGSIDVCWAIWAFFLVLLVFLGTQYFLSPDMGELGRCAGGFCNIHGRRILYAVVIPMYIVVVIQLLGGSAS